MKADRSIASCLPYVVIMLTTACEARNSISPSGHDPIAIAGELRESREGFTSIRSVVEMPDETALVLDYLDRSLHVVDFTDGTRRTVSGIGRGPGEYESPSSLLRWRGDSVLLTDNAIFNRLVGFTPTATASHALRTGREETNERFYTYRTSSTGH